jgi:hypothetical protein
MSYNKTGLSLVFLAVLLIAIRVDVEVTAILAIVGMAVFGFIKWRQKRRGQGVSTPSTAKSSQKKTAQPKKITKLQQPGAARSIAKPQQRPRTLPSWKIPPRR